MLGPNPVNSLWRTFHNAIPSKAKPTQIHACGKTLSLSADTFERLRDNVEKCSEGETQTCSAEVFSSEAPDQYKLMSSPIELKKMKGRSLLPRNLISIPAEASSLSASFSSFVDPSSMKLDMPPANTPSWKSVWLLGSVAYLSISQCAGKVIASQVIRSWAHLVTKPIQEREPVGAVLRGKKGLARGNRVEREEDKKNGQPSENRLELASLY